MQLLFISRRRRVCFAMAQIRLRTALTLFFSFDTDDTGLSTTNEPR